MDSFDLAIAYKWEFDEEFVNLIEKIFQREGLRTFVINKFNVDEVIDLLKEKELHFKAFLDRASDEDRAFLPLSKILRRKKCYLINPHDKAIRAIDKCVMHKKLVKKNFRLPKTFLLPAFEYDERLPITEEELHQTSMPFIIKPALFSGGGEGVIKNAETRQQIQEERTKNPLEKYLVQEKIHPRTLHGRRAWFRVFWAFGNVIPTWWDDHTHIYYRLTKKEMLKYNLLSLNRITHRLARLAKLDYFSTEIALTKNHKFFLIDYVNDQCDMRLKSIHPDGVPDIVVREIINHMKDKVSSF